jgi:hypothetical protein
MPVTGTPSNHVKFELASGNIDFDSNTIKIILMDTGFIFDKDVHANYDDGLGADDVIDNEISNGNGYTTGGNTLTGVALEEDDINDRCNVTWNSSSWTASGGDIGPATGAVVYNATPAADADKTVIGYIDFGADQTATNGGVFTINDIEVRIL